MSIGLTGELALWSFLQAEPWEPGAWGLGAMAPGQGQGHNGET